MFLFVITMTKLLDDWSTISFINCIDPPPLQKKKKMAESSLNENIRTRAPNFDLKGEYDADIENCFPQLTRAG